MARNYWDFAGFGGIYLEDSWVLSILASPGILTMECDLVLQESHPEYSPPIPTEHYCYRAGPSSFAMSRRCGGRGRGRRRPTTRRASGISVRSTAWLKRTDPSQSRETSV